MKKSYDEIEKSKPDGKLITRAMGANPFIQKGNYDDYDVCILKAICKSIGRITAARKLYNGH